MKTISKLRVFSMRGALVFVITLICALTFANESIPNEDRESSAYVFPLEFSSANNSTFTVYSPQLGEWDGFILTGVSAVSVLEQGETLPTYGMISFSVQTDTDNTSQTVRLDDFKITDANFPSAKEKSGAWVSELSQNIPKQFSNLPLSAVKEVITASSADESGIKGELRNNPPKIVFSEKPTVLIPIDGEPKWFSVGNNGLERAVNTQVLLLRDGSSFYIRFWDGYIKSGALNGPWSAAMIIPEGVKEIESEVANSGQVDLLRGEEDLEDGTFPSLEKMPLPDIYVATEPTELIVCDGAPQWNPVPGTQLLYIGNTSSYVFKELGSQKTYILLSGRWFESSSFEGPWSYVSSFELPGDFALIPDDSPQEVVKASVAGTEQAKEAAIANLVPETVRVERDSAKLENVPDYGNEGPQLKAIENTSLHYVINSNTPIIKVNANSWYACENGVWFFSDSAYGPWVVATSVPAEIYRIPVSCPIYYVSYVRLYRWSGNYVWFGYTPGYYGAIIGPEGTVVYGTGYYYQPYVSSYYYVSYPISYGYAVNPCWTPWRGWYIGFSFGYSYYWGRSYYCPRPPAPYWGPYRNYFYGRNHHPNPRIHSWNDVRWHGRGRPGEHFDRPGSRPNVTHISSRPSERFNGVRYNSRTREPIDPRRSVYTDGRIRINRIQSASDARNNEYNYRSSGMARPSGLNPPENGNRRPESANAVPRERGRNADNYSQKRRNAINDRREQGMGNTRDQGRFPGNRDVRPRSDGDVNITRPEGNSRPNRPDRLSGNELPDNNVRRENEQMEERIRQFREKQAVQAQDNRTGEDSRRPERGNNTQINPENQNTGEKNFGNVERGNRPNRTERPTVTPQPQEQSRVRPERSQDSSVSRSSEMRNERRENSRRESTESRPAPRQDINRDAPRTPREQRPERTPQQVQPRENPRPQQVQPSAPNSRPTPPPAPNNSGDDTRSRGGRRR